MTKTKVMQKVEFDKTTQDLVDRVLDAMRITERLMAEVYGTTKEFEYLEKLYKPLHRVAAVALAMRYPKKAIDQRRERIRDDYYKAW